MDYYERRDLSDKTTDSREGILRHMAEYGCLSRSQQTAYLTLLGAGGITERDLNDAKTIYLKRTQEKAAELTIEDYLI